MTFQELYLSIKKKLNKHPEITLTCEKLAVQITDVFDNAFYILWENNQCSVEPFHYHDYNVSIIASQRDIELLFIERQYLFLARQTINIKGSFTDVMAFQELLSYVTKDNSYIVQEEIISKMLMKQDMLSRDLGIIMQSLQLLLTSSLIALPENYSSEAIVEKSNNEEEKISDTIEKKQLRKKKTVDDKSVAKTKRTPKKSVSTPSVTNTRGRKKS